MKQKILNENEIDKHLIPNRGTTSFISLKKEIKNKYFKFP